MDGAPLALLCLVAGAIGGVIGGALANREHWLAGHGRRLASPAMLVWAPAIAFVLAMPALSAGLHPEDYFLRAHALHAPTWSERWFSLFGSSVSDPALIRLAKANGGMPWFAPETIDSILGRPLSSVTHTIDFLLFDRWPWVMHLHSLLWFVVAVAGVARLYRQVLPSPMTAGLAALLYAVDYTHGWPAGWIANRNALISAAFAFWALGVHDRRARPSQGGERPTWPAAGLFGLSLLAGETGLCGLAYLLAHVLVLDRRPVRRRLASMAPYLVVLLIWIVGYRMLGFGNHTGSALYVDPVDRPLAFLRTAVVRLPAYLIIQLSGATFDAFAFSTWMWVVNGLALLGFVLLAPAVLWRSRESRFFALGGLGALVPLCAGPVGDRQLLFPAVGAMAVIAQVLASVTEREHGKPRSRALLVGVAVPWASLLFVHLALSPLRSVIQSAGVGSVARLLEFRAANLFEGVEDASDVTVVRGSDMWGCTLDISLAHVGSTPRVPARCLSGTPSRVFVRRLDETTLVVRPSNGFIDSDLNKVNWDDRRPMRRGQALDLTFAQVTVTEVSARGEPVEAEFRFADTLDDPRHRWVVWRGWHYERFAMPAIGERIEIE